MLTSDSQLLRVICKINKKSDKCIVLLMLVTETNKKHADNNIHVWVILTTHAVDGIYFNIIV